MGVDAKRSVVFVLKTKFTATFFYSLLILQYDTWRSPWNSVERHAGILYMQVYYPATHVMDHNKPLRTTALPNMVDTITSKSMFANLHLSFTRACWYNDMMGTYTHTSCGVYRFLRCRVQVGLKIREFTTFRVISTSWWSTPTPRHFSFFSKQRPQEIYLRWIRLLFVHLVAFFIICLCTFLPSRDHNQHDGSVDGIMKRDIVSFPYSHVQLKESMKESRCKDLPKRYDKAPSNSPKPVLRL